jgi:hypothetical protein
VVEEEEGRRMTAYGVIFISIIGCIFGPILIWALGDIVVALRQIVDSLKRIADFLESLPEEDEPK